MSNLLFLLRASDFASIQEKLLYRYIPKAMYSGSQFGEIQNFSFQETGNREQGKI